MRGGYLIFFEEPGSAPAVRRESAAPAAAAPAEGEIAQLRRENEQFRKELAATKEYLEAVIDQQGAANEELKSANEEILSANEELQSTNEELQTTKEELSSTNEELLTLNEELRSRNQEVSQVNDDLTNLLSSLKMPIVMLGVDLRIRRFTPAGGKVIGLTAADLGRPIANIHTRLEVADLENMLAEVISSVVSQEREVWDAEGHWHLMRIHPYRTADNRIDGAILAMLDINEVRLAQEQLREARDYAVAVVETVTQPLLVLDADLRVRSANRSFCQVFRVTPQETIDQRIYELGAGQWASPKLRVLLEDVLPKGTSFDDLEVEHDFPRIGQRVMLLNARRLEKEGDRTQLILLAFDDVTDRRQSEQQRARLAEMEAGAAAKDQFMASLSHELRTPLTPVLATITMLQRHEGLDAETQERLEVVRRNIEMEARLIDNLLDVTRISRGKIELNRQTVELCKIIYRAVEVCMPDMEARRQEFALDLGPEAPYRVNADPARLQQVFWNLLKNAAKFTPHSGCVGIRCRREEDTVLVEVYDSGQGIEPDVLPTLFKAFEQGARG